MCISCFRPKASSAYPSVKRWNGLPYPYNENVGVTPLSSSPTSVFAPCGYCNDCANSKRYAWAWRLASDLQYYIVERGYKVGFCTLTYNDDMLPRFPSKYPSLSGMPCFDKEHTDKLILYLRKTLHRDYGCKEFLYFLSSERGEHTYRPHYHLIIAWNPACGLTGEELHRRIKHYWSEPIEIKSKLNPFGEKLVRPALGFVTPRDYMGGERRRDGKRISPFEVQNLTQCLKAAFYTAKYVTKDIYFMRDIYDKVSKDVIKSPDFKRFLPHHRQSKSLGFHSVASLSDAQKIELLLRGRALLGSDKLSMPPLYIQHKLMFSPCYMLNSKGERLVLREATQFFKDYFWLLMDKKVAYYNELFERMKDEQYWTSSGLEPSDAHSVASFVRINDLESLFGTSLGEAYVFYYGMKYEYCFTDKRLTYLNRYKHPALTYSSILIDEYLYANIQDFFGYLMSFCRWQKESERDEQADITRMYNNVVPLLGVG